MPPAAQMRAHPIYFAMDWCPEPDELDVLRTQLLVRMSGCCVFMGTPHSEQGLRAGALSAFKHRIISEPAPQAGCTGTTAALLKIEEMERAAAAQQATENAKEAPRLLRALDGLQFCAAYGTALRDSQIEGLNVANAESLVRAEATRRKYRFDDRTVTAGRIGIGATTCAVYAAWGLPRDTNRTIRRGQVDVQHVFGGAYVYTVNGIVTAIQD